MVCILNSQIKYLFLADRLKNTKGQSDGLGQRSGLLRIRVDIPCSLVLDMS